MPAHVQRACDLEGIDHAGLDRQEVTLLKMLRDAAGPVRLQVLASKLGVPAGTVADIDERFLLRRGLMQRTAEGRVITTEGMKHLQHQQPMSTERR